MTPLSIAPWLAGWQAIPCQRDAVDRINAVRNDIAHSLFPQNRKGHMAKRKRLYQGDDIFTLAGHEEV